MTSSLKKILIDFTIRQHMSFAWIPDRQGRINFYFVTEKKGKFLFSLYLANNDTVL